MTALPESLLAYAERGPVWAAWIERLPRLVRELVEEWSLTPDGAAMHGHTALVLPVRTTGGRPAVLKIGWPHPEAEHEALALQHWHGRGAVQLLRADPHRWALLLERLDTEDLVDLWDLDACGIVAGLYRQLHVPAPPQLRLLSEQATRWVGEFGALPKDAPLPRRMVEHARSLAQDFASDPACDGTLVHTDLHFANVLLDRAGDVWRAIDPKPLSGDPHYELAPMLWNRFDEYAGREREAIRDRFFALVDGAELDEDRARDWVIVRMLVNIKDELLTNAAPDRSWTSMMLTITKAVQG
ncbi:aminoglycoside phosphotransferase family protein [Nocardioides nematodiphilus]|uniref:aminoglycoside phosphotransferase family protein n=1 Tax=Nocardioides nematodiphilus TaxID=2849669 RepID=UPI001CD9FB05|nr:aminoglycoside phosphotransferase family protein [Nocardioides nematodiphilus]MCA1983907.1 aminoglycoside phosphotransferase family protein [Nocardioides nematodiphilus]